MSGFNPLSKGEEEILTQVGYLVMKWNFAEWCARQILRRYAKGDSLDDPDHLKLSARTAKWIEDELRDAALPKWQGSGRPYLERLINAYASAREHRNHVVHGIFGTAHTGGDAPAQAILIPSMPKNNQPQLPQHITTFDLQPIAVHFHDLTDFARKVMVAFDPRGGRALNADGSPVIDSLPTFITPLPRPQYVTM